MVRLTRKMQAVQDSLDRPLDEALADMVTEHGLSATADEIGVSKATLGYWLMKFRLSVRRVVLRDGETITINRGLS